jgi:lipoyl(octanoyl) transferase
MSETINYRKLGMLDYQQSYKAMSMFSAKRQADSKDEIWCLQHSPVYTLGMAGKESHVIDAGQIPVIKTDRGGQVTYHGPGQLVMYLLFDLRRKKIGIKDYVHVLEQAVIDYLGQTGLKAMRRPGAPGVYIDDSKIAALGVRVRRGCCYHGLALNVDMDLAPFQGINPCGYAGLEVTQLADFNIRLDINDVGESLLKYLLKYLASETYNIEVKSDLTDLHLNDLEA